VSGCSPCGTRNPSCFVVRIPVTGAVGVPGLAPPAECHPYPALFMPGHRQEQYCIAPVLQWALPLPPCPAPPLWRHAASNGNSCCNFSCRWNLPLTKAPGHVL